MASITAWLLVLLNVTWAGRRELEDVDENSFVGITRVEGQHPVVDVLLRALGLIARSQKSAGRIREEAGLESRGLRILENAVDDGPPFAVDVSGALGHGVDHLGGAKVALGPDPVRRVVGRAALWSPSVRRVVKQVFLQQLNLKNILIWPSFQFFYQTKINETHHHLFSGYTFKFAPWELLIAELIKNTS